MEAAMEEAQTGKCVYVLKTGKNLYKIGKTQNLPKRLAAYHTHLPILFRVLRQYPAQNMTELEESLHIVFQHKRVKGEWFALTNDDISICDNIARNFALEKLQKQPRKYPEIRYSDNPMLQVMEANERYLGAYAKIVDDIKLGLSTEEIVEQNLGAVSKATVATVRKVMQSHTPNAELLSQWIPVLNDMAAGLSDKQILEKYAGQISKATLQLIKRILRNNLF